MSRALKKRAIAAVKNRLCQVMPRYLLGVQMRTSCTKGGRAGFQKKETENPAISLEASVKQVKNSHRPIGAMSGRKGSAPGIETDSGQEKLCRFLASVPSDVH